MGERVPRARSQKGTGSIKAGQFAALSLCNVASLEAQFILRENRALPSPSPPASAPWTADADRHRVSQP